MAATSRMRLTTARNIFPLCYAEKSLEEIYKHGFNPQLLDIQIEHTPVGTSFAEISAPTAVFDGSSLDKVLAIVSSSANDIDAADKDVRKVILIGINKDTGKIDYEEIAMAGTDTEDFTKTFERIFHAYASSWGSNGQDAAGNITIGTHGYQEFGLTGKLSTTASGLAASTQYYFKINLDTGGVTEYSITTATDVTIGAIITLINTALAAVDCSISLVDGDLRITSTNSIGSGSTIAVTAGTTGTDLLGTLTDFTSMESAVAGTTCLTITAGDNESSGAAFYIPEGYKAVAIYNICSLLEAAAVTDLEAIKVAISGGVFGSDPDTNVLGTIVSMGLGNQTSLSVPMPIIPIPEECKVTFQDLYVANAKKLMARIIFAIFPNTKQ